MLGCTFKGFELAFNNTGSHVLRSLSSQALILGEVFLKLQQLRQDGQFHVEFGVRHFGGSRFIVRFRACGWQFHSGCRTGSVLGQLHQPCLQDGTIALSLAAAALCTAWLAALAVAMRA